MKVKLVRLNWSRKNVIKLQVENIVAEILIPTIKLSSVLLNVWTLKNTRTVNLLMFYKLSTQVKHVKLEKTKDHLFLAYRSLHPGAQTAVLLLFGRYSFPRRWTEEDREIFLSPACFQPIIPRFLGQLNLSKFYYTSTCKNARAVIIQTPGVCFSRPAGIAAQPEEGEKFRVKNSPWSSSSSLPPRVSLCLETKSLEWKISREMFFFFLNFFFFF